MLVYFAYLLKQTIEKGASGIMSALGVRPVWNWVVNLPHCLPIYTLTVKDGWFAHCYNFASFFTI
jgi:hypothetical protein